MPAGWRGGRGCLVRGRGRGRCRGRGRGRVRIRVRVRVRVRVKVRVSTARLPGGSRRSSQMAAARRSSALHWRYRASALC